MKPPLPRQLAHRAERVCRACLGKCSEGVEADLRRSSRSKAGVADAAAADGGVGGSGGGVVLNMSLCRNARGGVSDERLWISAAMRAPLYRGGQDQERADGAADASVGDGSDSSKRDGLLPAPSRFHLFFVHCQLFSRPGFLTVFFGCQITPRKSSSLHTVFIIPVPQADSDPSRQWRQR